MTYLFSANGEAILVDPQRDIDRFIAAAEDIHTRISWVVETHVHNDYVSGARAVARKLGAELLLPAGAGVAFDHVPAFHLEDIALGSTVIRPIHTPGHTPEHVSYLILTEDLPRVVFTGGSLLAGSVGRTDLIGPAQTRQLARLQIASVRRLATLPSSVAVYPTHGRGSFCVTNSARGITSTIGEELSHNGALAPRPVDDLVDGMLAGLSPYPVYYGQMGRINRLQQSDFPDTSPPRLGAAALEAIRELAVVDTRPRRRFASGHVPGSLNIELGDSFATWVGWLLPFNSEIALIVEDAAVRESIVSLARIGFDRVIGVVPDLSFQEGIALVSTPTVSASQLGEAIVSGQARQVLDVRSPGERTSSALPGSIHIYLPDLADRALAEMDQNETVWVACATGFRAAAATGILEHLGFDVVMTIDGGIQDLAGLVVPH
ncbi:MAG: MBL fold metallo-hydrolase [Actinobacteria bacterium]|nr:MBL fold metallo-hydrolase [Actinomycetota bacterium]